MRGCGLASHILCMYNIRRKNSFTLTGEILDDVFWKCIGSAMDVMFCNVILNSLLHVANRVEGILVF